MFHADLKYGSHVLWGDPSLLDRVVAFAPDAIGTKDVEKLMRNRLVTYLEAYSAKFSDGMTREQSVFLEKQTAKVVFACIDAQLILDGSYATHYKNKLEAFAKRAPREDQLELARRAHSARLEPGGAIEDPVDFWEQCGAFYRDTISAVMRRRYRLALGPRGMAAIFLVDEARKPGRFARRRRQGRLHSPVHGAQALLLDFRGSQRRSVLDWARRLISFYEAPAGSDWESLRSQSVRIWYRMMH
jgi:hypothetical protein